MPGCSEGEEHQSSGYQIVVQGIPWAYKWSDLKDMFTSQGYAVVRADIAERGGRSRGFGTVRFESAEQAQQAIEQFHNSELEGRTLTVRLDKFA